MTEILVDDLTTLDGDPVKRALVITAHPDDVDFGAAGSVAAWTSAGVDVAYCIVTDGAAGSQDPSIARGVLAAVREREQRAAAATVGVDDVRFLGYPDGRLECTLELRCDLARVIRQVRPQRVLCQSPEILWDRIYASHPDHRAAGEAALAAVYPDARNPFSHDELVKEGLEPWTVAEVWVMAHPEVNRVVDITETIDKKIAALRCHESQRPDGDGNLEERLRTWAVANAQIAGLSDGRLAEAFRVIDTR